jgi:serine/threonine protein kinase
MSINEYRICKDIGKGNFATVYKAINRQTNETCAIKIFSKKLNKSQEELAKK